MELGCQPSYAHETVPQAGIDLRTKANFLHSSSEFQGFSLKVCSRSFRQAKLDGGQAFVLDPKGAARLGSYRRFMFEGVLTLRLSAGSVPCLRADDLFGRDA